MRVFCVGLLILVSAVSLSYANETIEVLSAEPVESAEPVSEEEVESESLEDPYSSVNMSEEYGFDSKQNVDSFLGDVYNPAKPLSSDSTYKGSRSEMRNDREDY